MRSAVALALLAACSFTNGAMPIPSIDSASSIDTVVDDAKVVDTAVAIDSAFGAWSMPTPVAITGINNDDDPTLTSDMLELYFNRAGQIFSTKRTAVTSGWNGPMVVSSISTTSVETTPMLSPDGLTIYWASDRNGSLGNVDIWTATRSSLSTTTWTNLTQLTTLSSTAADTSMTVTTDGLSAILVSGRLSSMNDDDLFMSSRPAADAPWPAAVPVVELNTGQPQVSPFLMPDGLTLYFAQNTGNGDDLYYATRATVNDPFSAPVAITELNSAMSDSDPWVSPDGRHMFFASDRGGSFRLYESSR